MTKAHLSAVCALLSMAAFATFIVSVEAQAKTMAEIGSPPSFWPPGLFYIGACVFGGLACVNCPRRWSGFRWVRK